MLHELDRPGRRLFGGALAFRMAAGFLYKHAPQPTPWATCFVNLAFSVEFGLKGFLRERGGSAAQQRALGHDLVNALEAAKSVGFVAERDYEEFIRQLSPYSKDMGFRYLEGDETIDLPPIPDALETVGKLLRELYDQCKPADEEPLF